MKQWSFVCIFLVMAPMIMPKKNYPSREDEKKGNSLKESSFSYSPYQAGVNFSMFYTGTGTYFTPMMELYFYNFLFAFGPTFAFINPRLPDNHLHSVFVNFTYELDLFSSLFAGISLDYHLIVSRAFDRFNNRLSTDYTASHDLTVNYCLNYRSIAFISFKSCMGVGVNTVVFKQANSSSSQMFSFASSQFKIVTSYVFWSYK